MRDSDEVRHWHSFTNFFFFTIALRYLWQVLPAQGGEPARSVAKPNIQMYSILCHTAVLRVPNMGAAIF